MKFIPMAIPSLGPREEQFVKECIKSTWISSAGGYIDQFESAFAQKFKVKYAVSCNSGTSALHLALLALNIGKGDEVIVPVLTFVATANAVRYTGATPVFVDINPHTWNIDVNRIEEKISKRTKAIIPVHLYGYPANMDAITILSKKYNFAIVEDAAEAHGAMYRNKLVGTIGDLGCFSFYGNKIITTGEGGMVVTNKNTLSEKMKLLRNHGMHTQKKYWHPVIGFNYRMTNIQAALGLAQLERLDVSLEKRFQLKRWYLQFLQGIPGLEMPHEDTILEKSVNWLFTMRILKSRGKNRNSLINYLKKKGVDSRPAFYPITDFPTYRDRASVFPIAKRFSQEIINLPTYPSLTKKQIKYISTTIGAFMQS